MIGLIGEVRLKLAETNQIVEEKVMEKNNLELKVYKKRQADRKSQSSANKILPAATLSTAIRKTRQFLANQKIGAN